MNEGINPLDGMVAIVTGAGGSLGEAICHTLSDAGVTVAVADIRIDKAEGTAQALRGKGCSALALRLDVSDEQFAANVVATVNDEFGHVDILVNNAGVDVTLPIDDLSVSEWDRILAVNLRGPFLMTKQVLEPMRAAGRGHIVNIVSTAAKRSWANASAYNASKWGLLGFSHALHAELRPHKIKVSAIVSGAMHTPFLLERFPDINAEALQDPYSVARTVQFVLSQPEDTVVPEVIVLPMHETSWP
jgi:NADP-dependent 3-hydroxy acid dehydrogenase YdfG